MAGEGENDVKHEPKDGNGDKRPPDNASTADNDIKETRKGEHSSEKKVPVPKAKRKQIYLASKSGKRAGKSAFLTDESKLLQTEEAGVLQPETDLEQTLHVRQAHIRPHLDLASASKAAFQLDLEATGLSPYNTVAYSRSSRSLLIASRKGHVAVSNWRNLTSHCELHLNETVRSATFLHNDAFFATAQKLHAYIYDSSGAQVHVLRTHHEPGSIVSLPYHLLLATVSAPDAPLHHIVYTDTTTGEPAGIGQLGYADRTLGLSAAHTAAINNANGVLHVGHHSGAVSLWSPIVERPLARIFLHAGGARHVAVLPRGDAMVSVGANGELKVTDLRTFRTRSSWKIPSSPTALAVSQRGLVAVGFGASVQVFAQPGSQAARVARVKREHGSGGGDGNGVVAPYMMETFSGRRVTGLEFCPFEDVLAVCHHHGMVSMMVPGAGEATFDSSAPNPYETRKQRREKEVRMLLDKLPANTIGLDANFVASVDDNPEERLRELRKREVEANVERLRGNVTKRKAKGRDKISKRLVKRRNRMMEASKLERREEVAQSEETRLLAQSIKEKDSSAVAAGTKAGDLNVTDLPDALRRFVKK